MHKNGSNKTSSLMIHRNCANDASSKVIVLMIERHESGKRGSILYTPRAPPPSPPYLVSHPIPALLCSYSLLKVSVGNTTFYGFCIRRPISVRGSVRRSIVLSSIYVCLSADDRFLDAPLDLYKRVCPSIGSSVHHDASVPMSYRSIIYIKHTRQY